LRQLIDALTSGLIAGTVERACSAGAADFEDVRKFPSRLAAFSAETGETSRSLKRFLHQKVYASPELGEDRQRSMAMIGELFAFFLAHPDRLPEAYREQNEGEPPHRIVCDYIAGMTDAFFRRVYDQTVGAGR
jgi:dGTPase